MTLDWCPGIREACAHWRNAPTLRFLLPGGDELPINIEVSRLLYQLDRDAYVEALNAARGEPASVVESVKELGDA